MKTPPSDRASVAVELGGQAVAFQRTGIGDAWFTPPPRSPPISKRLEGRWSATAAIDGKHLTIGLAMANPPCYVARRVTVHRPLVDGIETECRAMLNVMSGNDM
jgi:hypothetical protein